MNKFTFPPSPNWFLSNALACLEDGTTAYASGCIIVLIEPIPYDTDTSTSPVFHLLPKLHRERITAVSFSPTVKDAAKYTNCLVSGSDDGRVLVWDLKEKNAILAHATHEHHKVTCVDWSPRKSDVVISGDDQGWLVCWDLYTNVTRVINLAGFCGGHGRRSVLSIACCPHMDDVVAIGCREGLLYVFDISKTGRVIHRLSRHDYDVVSLAWCPVNYNVLQKDDAQKKNDILLASGSRENVVYIWRISSTEGRFERKFVLPTKPFGRGHKVSSSKGDEKRGWVTVCWPTPEFLLTNSMWNELIGWDLVPPEENAARESAMQKYSKYSYHLAHSIHSRGLFNIACARKWDESGKRILVWTAAQDRQLVAFELISGKVLMVVPTFGSFVYCLAASPVDSSRIAVGAGDSLVRIWNTSKQSSVDMITLWRPVKKKVMSLAWHPQKENWLAYGTDEGRVGLFDLSTGRAPILFRSFHRFPVYCLAWAPSVCIEGSNVTLPEYSLYSCGDNDIFQFNPDKPDADPVTLSFILKGKAGEIDSPRTDMSWKPDYQLLAVGNKNGSVDLYKPPYLTHVKTLLPFKKLILCMAWHPECTATDPEYSPYRHWLAVSSCENSIQVFDLTAVMNGDSSGCDGLGLLKSAITLTGHNNKVLHLAWSPHISGQLVSASNDFTARVWNVTKQETIAIYADHAAHVMCCMWSSVDPDFIITGSEDFTLRVWKLSEHPEQNFVDKNNLKQEALKNRKEARKQLMKLEVQKKEMIAQSAEVTPVEDSVSKSESQKNANVPPDQLKMVQKEKDASYGPKKITKKSFFPVTSIMHNHGLENFMRDCNVILQTYENKQKSATEEASSGDGGMENGVSTESEESPTRSELGSDNLIHLGFFGDRDAMLRLMDEEAKHHQNTNMEYFYQMQLWKGKVSDALKEAARRMELTDWHVAMAPMVNHMLWREMCEAYANQLAEDGRHHKAASYLLMCQKVDKAIQHLVRHKFFREALAIVQCRLPSDESTINDILSKWADHLFLEGNYELAVKCCISVGKFVEAAKILNRKADVASRKLGAFLAKKGGDRHLARTLAEQCINDCLLKYNWSTAYAVIEEHPELQDFALVVAVHRELATRSKTFDKFRSGLLSDFLAIGLEESLLDHIHTLWKEDQRCICFQNDPDKEACYGKLEKGYRMSQAPKNVMQVWVCVARELTLAALTTSRETRLSHLVQAMSICYEYELQFPKKCLLLQLSMWVTQSELKKVHGTMPEDSPKSQFLAKSLRAFLGMGLVHWIQDISDNFERLSSSPQHELENAQDENEILFSCFKLVKDYIGDLLDEETVSYCKCVEDIAKHEKEVASNIGRNKAMQNGVENEKKDVQVGSESKDVQVESENKDVQVESERKDVQMESVSKDVQVESANKDVQVESASKDVQVESASKDIQVESASKDIQVESASKNAQVESASKDVQVESASKDVKVESASKDVQVESASKDVQVESASKDIQVESASKNAQVESASKDVQVESASKDIQGESESVRKEDEADVVSQTGDNHMQESQQGGVIGTDLGKLQLLKEQKRQFEETRIASPNPYNACDKLTDICKRLLIAYSAPEKRQCVSEQLQTLFSWTKNNTPTV